MKKGENKTNLIRLIEMYQGLEDWIIKDIAMRLVKAGSLSGTADRELWKLQQMGLHHTEIVKRISQESGKSRDEVRRLLQDSVMTSFSNDMEVLAGLGNVIPPLQKNEVIKVMDAELKKTYGELDNLTQSTMVQSQKDLLNMLNEAEYRVSSGLQSYSAAVCDLLDQYGKSGVMIEYPTGAKRTLEAAVRMCIVTAMNQTAAQVTNQYIAEHGIEYVLVSAHLGARPQRVGQPYLAGHENWQGKVYKIVGSDPDTPNLAEMTGYDIVDGVGHVVNPLGLHGYNCRHSHSPWYKDLRNPYVDKDGNWSIDTEENRKTYEMQQAQRAMERAIRKIKRQLLVKQEELNMIAETDVREMLQPEYDKLAYKLRLQNQKYKQYCADNGLQTQADRVKVVGFKRAQSAKANGRATAYQNANMENIKKSGATSGAVYNYKNDPDGSKRQKIAEDLYSQTRNRNSEYEVKAVAQNSGMSEVDVKKIYDHIYVNKHLFKDGTIHLFDPDYEMAQSWQRLRNNTNIQPHDITLLKHELAEYNVMGESLDIAYEPVHNEVVKTYNYQKELIQYLKERGRE